MHLAPASFDPQLMERDTLQYSEGLNASIKMNHVLVEQSFHRALEGDEGLRSHTFQPRDFIYRKDTSRKAL